MKVYGIAVFTIYLTYKDIYSQSNMRVSDVIQHLYIVWRELSMNQAPVSGPLTDYLLSFVGFCRHPATKHCSSHQFFPLRHS